MANRRFTQFLGTLHYKPVRLDCKFKVDSTANAGISGLKGAGIQAVYMHTSGTTPNAVNPAAGLIVVKFQDNYNNYYFSGSQFRSPLTGSAISISSSSVLTAGNAYEIVTLGTSTQAQWQAAGLPAGATMGVGAGFLALVTGGGGGSGTVKAIGKSGTHAVELIGDPLQSLYNSGAIIAGQANGAYLLLQCLAPTAAGNTALIPTAPADGSYVHLTFDLSNSFLQQNGD